MTTSVLTSLQIPTWASLTEAYQKYSVIPHLKGLSAGTGIMLLAYLINDIILFPVEVEKEEKKAERLSECHIEKLWTLLFIKKKQTFIKNEIQKMLDQARKELTNPKADDQQIIYSLIDNNHRAFKNFVQKRFKQLLLPDPVLMRKLHHNQDIGAWMNQCGGQLKTSTSFETLIKEHSIRYFRRHINAFYNFPYLDLKELDQQRETIANWVFSNPLYAQQAYNSAKETFINEVMRCSKPV